ncbi:hypothetical protein J3B02_006192, partial [Coemansia erecta]
NTSGFETPKVSRKAIRHRVNGSVSGMSPPHDIYDSPHSVSDPFDESSVSVVDCISPSRLSSVDEGTAKAIQKLFYQRSKLKKEVDENKNRMQISSEKHEREIAQLNSKIDELSAELSHKRREIEKLRMAEKSHAQTMEKTEESMSRLGFELNSSQRLSSHLKHQLEKKTELLGNAERRVIDKEAQIYNLKATADAREQQVTHLKSQASELEYQIIELRNDLDVAREYQERSRDLERENISLNETIANLNVQINDLRRQVDSALVASRAHEAENGVSNGTEAERRANSNRSLFEELETSGVYDLSGVDDDVAYGKITTTRNRGQSVPSSLASTS